MGLSSLSAENQISKGFDTPITFSFANILSLASFSSYLFLSASASI